MEKLYIYKIRPEYARYLHNIDYRVSMKCEARPFVGIITMGSGVQYLLSLTSQTTSMRLAKDCRKRSSSVTTFIRDRNGEEIAEILHNNMIPVKDGLYIKMEISAETNIYESNEIRFFRKKHDNIISKAKKSVDSQKLTCLCRKVVHIPRYFSP